jgi:hypothetical protein
MDSMGDLSSHGRGCIKVSKESQAISKREWYHCIKIKSFNLAIYC